MIAVSNSSRVAMTTIAPITIASATAPNWLAEAQGAIMAAENQSGMLGALENSKHGIGTIQSFLNNTLHNAEAFALITLNNSKAAGTLSSQAGAAVYEKALAEKLQKALAKSGDENFTPPKGLDPFIFFEDGSTIDTVNGILTLASGKQLDITTGLEIIATGDTPGN